MKTLLYFSILLLPLLLGIEGCESPTAKRIDFTVVRVLVSRYIDCVELNDANYPTLTDFGWIQEFWLWGGTKVKVPGLQATTYHWFRDGEGSMWAAGGDVNSTSPYNDYDEANSVYVATTDRDGEILWRYRNTGWEPGELQYTVVVATFGLRDNDCNMVGEMIFWQLEDRTYMQYPGGAYHLSSQGTSYGGDSENNVQGEGEYNPFEKKEPFPAKPHIINVPLTMNEEQFLNEEANIPDTDFEIVAIEWNQLRFDDDWSLVPAPYLVPLNFTDPNQVWNNFFPYSASYFVVLKDPNFGDTNSVAAFMRSVSDDEVIAEELITLYVVAREGNRALVRSDYLVPTDGYQGHFSQGQQIEYVAIPVVNNGHLQISVLGQKLGYFVQAWLTCNADFDANFDKIVNWLDFVIFH